MNVKKWIGQCGILDDGNVIYKGEYEICTFTKVSKDKFHKNLKRDNINDVYRIMSEDRKKRYGLTITGNHHIIVCVR